MKIYNFFINLVVRELLNIFIKFTVVKQSSISAICALFKVKEDLLWQFLFLNYSDKKLCSFTP